MNSFFDKYKKIIFAIIAVTAILAAAFCFGGNMASKEGNPVAEQENTVQTEASEETIPEEMPSEETPQTVQKEKQSETAEGETTSENPENTVKPEKSGENAVYTCTMSVSCATILDNMDKLDSDKTSLVPSDGYILAPVKVEFKEGENAFDVLLSTVKDNNIHMEYTSTPMYNSVYIEGIGNLYEFDCGDLSGWMFRINGWFPNYGCDHYVLKDGDVIEWVYTCDLGADVDGAYFAE